MITSQNSFGINKSISRSLSQSIFNVGDWTRPADLPKIVLLVVIGEILYPKNLSKNLLVIAASTRF